MQFRIKEYIFFSLFFVCVYTSVVFAHISIPSAPTTACGSIDSTDLTTHTSNQIDSLIGVADPFSTSKKLYSTEGDSTTMTGATTTAWVRNSDVWTGSLDFTGVNAWTQMYNGYSSRYQHKATLISPRHFVTAHHWGITPGATLAFITNTNETVYRTVSNTMQVGTTDIEVGVLDSDVPDSITYYPIVASSTLNTLLYKYVPPSPLDVPIVAFNQFEEVLTLQLYAQLGGVISFIPYTHPNSSNNPTRLPYSKNVVAGDSGSPLFMIIDGRPVVISLFSSATYGPDFGSNISQINSAITTLGNSGGYTVTEYNPTCFSSYVPNNIPNFTSSNATTTQAHYASATPIHTYTATDADAGDTLAYSLVTLQSVSSSTLSLSPSTYFSLDSSTGALSQVADIDTTVLGTKLALGVKVIDDHTPQAVRYATTTINVDYIAVTSAIRKNSTVEITYNNTLATTSIPSTSDFVVKVNGVTRSISSVVIADSIVRLTLSSPASTGDNITLSYTPGTNKIKDVRGSLALPISASSPLHISNSHAGDIDTSFDPGTGFNNTASTVTIGLDGKLYVGGFFTEYNGTTANRIIKLNADGSVDSSFNTGTAFGAGVGVNVSKILLQADGKILVFGLFSGYNGTAVTNIVRLNTDGSLDTTFNSGGAGLVGSYIQDADIQSDGKIVIAGQFTQYNGVNRYGVARLNTDGSLDTTFVPATDSSDTSIEAVHIQSDNKVLIAGGFYTVGGVTRNLLARLTSTGSLDSSFAPSATINDYLAEIYTIKQLANGNVMVGGIMSYANTNWSLALFDSSANNISYFDGSLTTESDAAFDIYEQSDGKLLAVTGGGVFVYGSHQYRDIIRLDETGILDETFMHTESLGGSTFSNSDGQISIDSNGDIYVVGVFTSHAGVARSGIMKLYGTTDTDITAPTITNVTSSASNGSKGVGTTIPIQITFNEVVTVTGTPVLTLSLGTTTRNVTYTSGSGTNTLVFNYVVQDGDYSSDLEYTNSSALALSGGTIADAASNNADLTLPTPQTQGSLSYNKNISIDGTLPEIFAVSVDGTTLTLVYTEELDDTSVPQSGDFVLKKNGSVQSGLIDTISISDSSVIMTLSATIKSTDSVTLAYTPGTHPIKDLALNEALAFVETRAANGSPEEAVSSSSGGGGGGGGSSGSKKDSPVSSPNITSTTTIVTTEGTGSFAYILSTQKARNLTLGSVGNDVFILQKYLNSLGFTVAQTGLGSAGKESTYFGLKTKNALARFQKSVGIVPATGYFGPKTRAYILSTLGNEVTVQIQTTNSTSTPKNLCTTNLYLTNPIKYGAKNNPDDVRLLESFLNTYEGNILPINGVYELADYKAVILFQEKYKESILIPWKLTKGTGYVYTTTLNKIKEVVEGECKK